MQVLKDPLGTQGRAADDLRLAAVALPGVHAAFGRGVGVSARIEDEDERERLRELVRDCATGAHGRRQRRGGYIVRTAADGAPLEALRADMLYLPRLWEHVRAGAAARADRHAGARGPAAVGARMLRDELRPDVRRVLVDDRRRSSRACAQFAARVHARGRSSASSCTRRRGRSSTCTASRRRSAARSDARCR